MHCAAVHWRIDNIAHRALRIGTIAHSASASLYAALRVIGQYFAARKRFWLRRWNPET